MKELLIRNKTFFKYLLSYLLLLILPLAVMSYLIFKNIVVEMERQIVTANMQMLAQVRNTLDKKLASLDKIAVEISLNPQLTPYQVSQSSYSQYQTYLELKKYANSDGFIYQLFLCMNKDPVIYSSTGNYSMDGFLTQSFTFARPVQDQLAQTLQSPGSRWVTPAPNVMINGLHASKNFILFAYPLPPDKNYVYGTALFFVAESEIKAMIFDILADYGGTTVILNQQGELIASSREIDEDDLASIRNLSVMQPEHTGNTANLIYDNKAYIANIVHSGFNDWSYLTLVPKEKYLQEVLSIKRSVYEGIAIVVVAGILAAFSFLLLNYVPIRKLRNILEGNQASPSYGYKDDVSFIRHAIQNVAQSNQELVDRIGQHKQYVRSHLLLMLLRGHIVDENEWRFLLKESDLHFTLPYFLVVIIAADTSKKALMDVPDSEMKWTRPGKMDIYRVEGFDDRKVVYILNIVSDTGHIPFIESGIAEIKAYMEAQSGLKLSAGVGNVYDSWNDISKSMVEASSALDYRLLRGGGQIIHYAKIADSTPSNWQPYEKLHMMSISIESGNVQQMEYMLTEVTEQLSQQNIPLYMARYYCFEIINTLMKVVRDLNIRWEHLPGGMPDLTKLAQFETVEQLKTNVYEIGINICHYTSKRIGSADRDLVEEIKEHIASNFRDQNFNFSDMAEAIGMSSPYLSRSFRDKTGLTMMDYLTELRMKEVCDQLANSDKLIKDVIHDAGYFDIASFNKKFKKLYGTSPSNYRTLRRTIRNES
ncbi:AraC family transcriptional regulator [Paenibacillus sp. MBLB4367]|uniref:AraC family transcriptional regulator n=1 Tax=Paenibacillus sp. MBLB4367 TaxID=3384767 RepID=UPI003908301A